jgi:catechol 2,3-dioxygenase-like lactoylglutathione lyase family enzyme
MTVTTNIDTSLTTIGITVPDAHEAADFVASLLGVTASDDASVPVGGFATVEFTSSAAPDQSPPRLVDIGTNHLCFTVGDIDAAASYLRARADVSVLGDVITVPEGPIAGNRWIYFRSPWGTLFELQQWPETPGYVGDTDARLHHRREDLPTALLPTCRGLDHSGYSVADLDATIALLVGSHSATEVLRTEIEADRGFMTTQFDLDVEGSSRMAMVSVGELNIELFEHHIGRQHGARPLTANGGNFLTLPTAKRTTGAVRLFPGAL